MSFQNSNLMLDRFNNNSGKNTMALTISSKGRSFILHYHLANNPVQFHWQTLYANSEKFVMGLSPRLSSKEILLRINEIANTSIEEPITQDQLNDLHRQFVLHANAGIDHYNWQKVNLLIHLLEDKLRETVLKDSNGSLRFFMDPEPVYIPLKEEYKLWLTTEKQWGDLLLGYATTGKGWWEISQDNDVADDLNVQKHIGSETLAIFQPESVFCKDVENRFYKWAKSANTPVPLNNLNKLALGRYYLGNIIISDVLLEYHNIPSDWYVPNHACKLNWTKEFIGSDATVTSVDFFDSDMYFKTLLKHTGLNLND